MIKKIVFIFIFTILSMAFYPGETFATDVCEDRLTGYVFNDINNNGYWEQPSEPGYDRTATVDLYTSTGTYLRSVQTNISGYFEFSVAGGSYDLRLNVPGGFFKSTPTSFKRTCIGGATGVNLAMNAFGITRGRPGGVEITGLNTGCIAANSPYITVSWQSAINMGTDGTYTILRQDLDTPTRASTPIATLSYNVTSYTDPTGAQPVPPINNNRYVYKIVAANGTATTVSKEVQIQAKNCAPPAVSSLKVNHSGTRVSSFSCEIYGSSGKQTSEKGEDCYNPMDITLNAIENGAPITEFYVGFYDKNSGVRLENKDTFLSELQARLNADPKRGFLLAYGPGTTGLCSTTSNIPCSTAKHYIWESNKWTPIVNEGIAICGSAGCVTQKYYVGFPRSNTSTSATWKMELWTISGSKSMYTGVLVRNSLGSSFDYDRTPTQ